MDSRQTLRKKLQTQRESCTPSKQRLASQKITHQLSNHPWFQQSRTMAAYVAIRREINPEFLMNIAWEQRKCCYLPILQKNQLIFAIYNVDTPLKKNYLTIPEPPFLPQSIINPHDLDLVLVPLLGFTTQGQRLGMGGGFYDRSFSFLLKKPRPVKPYLIGLAYEWQKLDNFTNRVWDVPLNAIATEKKIYAVSH